MPQGQVRNAVKAVGFSAVLSHAQVQLLFLHRGQLRHLRSSEWLTLRSVGVIAE